MERQGNNKKKYYSNNKKYYPRKKNKKLEIQENKITYDKLVNYRKSVEEVETKENFGANNIPLIVISILLVVIAIVFGILLLFHLI